MIGKLIGKFWGLIGNEGTVSGEDFIGTTDNMELDLRTNDIVRAQLGTSTTQENGTNNLYGRAIIGATGVAFQDGIGILNISPLMDDVPGLAPVSMGARISPTFEYIATLTSTFGSSGSINCTPQVRPTAGLGPGTDTHSVLGGLFNVGFNGNGTNRTISSVAGIQSQAVISQNGTATQLTGGTFQGGTVLGATATNVLSLLANPPFQFLGGNVVNGVTARFVGGNLGSASNWNCQWTGDVKSYHEGPLSVGHTNAPNFAVDANDVRVRAGGKLHLGGTTESGIGVTGPSLEMSSIAGTTIFRSVNQANNEDWLVDLANIPNLIRHLSLTGAGVQHSFIRFSIGSKQSVPTDNGFFYVTPANRDTQTAGDWSDYLFEPSGVVDLNSNMTGVGSMTVNEPDIDLGGFTADNTWVLCLGAAATEGTNNYGLWSKGGTARIQDLAPGGTVKADVDGELFAEDTFEQTLFDCNANILFQVDASGNVTELVA